MSETSMNLINAIRVGSATETESLFGAAMAEKLSGKLEDMRASVAQSMFKTQEDPTETEEE
jgi:hypothetical protein